mmetsp:Transcript_39517/g.86072  ORF Transcript_39517/g.86072 Transcript_39517/m.86072 type:complete len:129 (-) Transcript_39517:1034-1420(-)
MELRRDLMSSGMGMGGPQASVAFQRPRTKDRPMSEQFGPAPRWGEPRLPPRPFTGAPPPLAYRRELDKDAEIMRLNHVVRDLETQLRRAEHVHHERPVSGKKLPPMDGFSPPRKPAPKTAPPFEADHS